MDKEEIKKNKILEEQSKCQHGDLQLIRSLQFEYGIGVICGFCAKLMKEEQEIAWKNFFGEDFLEKRKMEQEQRDKTTKLKKIYDIANS